MKQSTHHTHRTKTLIAYIESHEKQLYRLAYSYVKEEGAALDVVQDAIVKALCNIENLRNMDGLKTWMYRIVVNAALDHIRKNRTGKRRMKQMAAGVLIAGTLFTTALNKSSSFAQAVTDIPIIGHLAQLVTFRSYSMDTPDIAGEVRVPELQKMRDPMVEALINVEIRNKMERHVEEAQMRAAEYREAYLATGGDPDAFRPLQIEVDYEIMSSTDQLLSFRVYAFESLASAYAENYYYTIDLAHNRVLSLGDMLGDEYVSVVNKQVRMEIERMKESPDNTFFEGDMGFQSIGTDQPFYVTSAGNPVVVFNKYEIAPGYMGRLEFEIKNP